MTVTANTLRDFGQTLGLTDLSLSHEGVIVLDMQDRGTLYMEQGKGEMLVYMVREIPPFEEHIFTNALRLCHPDRGHTLTVQAGLRGDDQLVFLVRMPDERFILPEIDRALNLLCDLHDRAVSNERMMHE